MFNKKLKEKIEQLKDRCKYLEDRCSCLDRNCEDLAMGEYRVNIANIQLQQEIKQLKEENEILGGLVGEYNVSLESTDGGKIKATLANRRAGELLCELLGEKMPTEFKYKIPTPEEKEGLPSSDECEHVYGSYVDCVNDELTKFRFNFCPRCGEILGERKKIKDVI